MKINLNKYLNIFYNIISNNIHKSTVCFQLMSLYFKSMFCSCLLICIFPLGIMGMGDVHTSAESVAKLVSAESSIIKTLKTYIEEEEERLGKIKKWVSLSIFLYHFYFFYYSCFKK